MNSAGPLTNGDGGDNRIGFAIDDADIAGTFVTHENGVIVRRLQTDWRKRESEADQATEETNFHEAMIKAWTCVAANLRARCATLTRSRILHDTIDQRFELLRFNRLDQMIDKSGLQTSINIRLHAESAHGDSGNGADRAHLHHKIGAGTVGQRDVAKEKIELVLNGCFHGGAHAVRCGHEMPSPNE